MVAVGDREGARKGRAARSRTGVRAVAARRGTAAESCGCAAAGFAGAAGVTAAESCDCGAAGFAGAESHGRGCGAVQSSVRCGIQTGGRGGGKGVRVAESEV